jgi:hypothetical protein
MLVKAMDGGTRSWRVEASVDPLRGLNDSVELAVTALRALPSTGHEYGRNAGQPCLPPRMAGAPGLG